MQISCEVCHSQLRPEDVRLDLAVARCQACNAVYDLSGRKARGLAETNRPQRLVRAKAVLPTHFQVVDAGSTTRISWRWRSFKRLFISIIGVFFLMGLHNADPHSKAPRVSALISFIGAAAGVGLAYYTLAGLLNRTRIVVNRVRLTIRHGPLPWLGNRDLPRQQLKQLYGEEIIGSSDGEKPTTYSLCAVDREGRKVKLISGLPERDQVLYLEQTLEHRLGIEDAPVDGEVATRLPTA